MSTGQTQTPAFLDSGKLPIAMVGVRVVGNNILAELIPTPEKSEGGIVLVSHQKEPIANYRIISTGCGWRTRKGALVAFDFKPGDEIIGSSNIDDGVRINGRTLKFLKNHEVLAIVEK